MAATDQHYRNQKTLDIVFAVSCVLMLISTIWMFVQDYNREFKQVQRDFRDVEAAVNDRMMLARLPDVAEVKARREKVEAARKELADTQENVAQLAREIQVRRDRQDAKTRSLKADFDAQSSYLVQTRDELNIATGAEKTRLENKMVAQEKDLDKLGADLTEAQKELEKIDAEYKTKVRKELGPKEEALSNAEDNLKKLTNEFDRFAKAAAQKTWKFGDTFRNLPILDAFNSPTRINQIVLPELTIDYSFKEVPRYDRCMTCHLGVDRGMFDRDALWAIGTAPEELTEKLQTARTILLEREKSGENLGFDPSDLPTKVRTMKLTKGQVTMYATHPRLDLFLDTNSPHPAQKFGCTICHNGQGSATDFNLASHAPANAHQEHEWQKTYEWSPNHDWDFPMLSNRFTESSCLKCHHQVTDLVTKGSQKEAPKVTRGYDLVRENGCFGCHEISGRKAGRSIGPDLRLEPVPPLDWLTPSEQTKLRSDPLNVPGTFRKVGPSLRRIVEKTNEEWTRKWIASPRTFRPDTKMPHFYGLSNNTREALKADREAREKATGKPDPVPQEDFPDAEIHSIAHYLFAESAAHLKADDTYRRALIQDLTAGLKNMEERALSDKEKKDLDEVTKSFIDLALLSMPARAAEINSTGADVRRLEDRFYGLYRRQTELEAQKKQNSSDEDAIQTQIDALPAEREAVAKELSARTKDLIDEAKPIPIAKEVQTVDHGVASVKLLEEKATPETIEKGRKLFTEKGCLACHSHDGTEGRGKTSVAGEANFGPNLSRMAAKLVKPEAGNDARRWLYQWILNPNIHHPRTKMPYTRLEEAEARDVADWLLSQPVKDYDEKDPTAPESKTLRMLARVYLAKAPGMSRADLEEAIPLDMSQKIGFTEERLHSMARDAEEHRLTKGASDDDLKWYIGKKSISRLGCYGCHDVAGFEQGKPIGTALNDWGKKDPARIAFEDSESYVRTTNNIVPTRLTKKDVEERVKSLEQRKNRNNARLKELEATKEDDRSDDDRLELSDLRSLLPLSQLDEEELKELQERLKSGGPFWDFGKDGQVPYEKFFYEALEHQTRDGFLHQKLMEPRSFDYNRTRAWDDRLRMPQFKFGRARRHHDESEEDFRLRQTQEEAEAREAVMTFILGLVAENISPKYIYKPAPDRLAEVKGRQVLEKYNCVGCHQARSSVFEFKLPDDARRRLQEKAEASAKRYQEKYAFAGHNAWTGTGPTMENRLTAIANFNPAYNPTKSADEAPVRHGHPVDKEGRYDLRLNEALRFTDPTGMTHDLPAGESIGVAPPDVCANDRAVRRQVRRVDAAVLD